MVINNICHHEYCFGSVKSMLVVCHLCTSVYRKNITEIFICFFNQNVGYG